ncbi:MAG TPA: M56 family metallopeptidase [Candidatus Sulfopaludibacter sp.]|jgi:TonB family protein|nr:M56 family metallopeptidase [Candidatus Sulfopaludibacter sp.]
MDWSATALSYLAGVTVRSLGLVVVALAGVAVLRVRTAAARHAVWTVTVAGMMLLAVLEPVMPSLPLRVLGAAPPEQTILLPAVDGLPASGALTGGIPAAAPENLPAMTWRQAAIWIYLAGAAIFLLRLAMGYVLTARLVWASLPVVDGPVDELYEASWITVPLTVGWLRPRILLPTGWRNWEAAKLRAVMVHEQTHVRRGDWAVALLAGVNRCIFWFHPAAWWLERQLAGLAEQACDDAALLEIGQREDYAQALLDMAAAVKSGEGRLVWEAMAMAKASEVRMRIERILDETRQIPSGVSRLRWAALVACSLPLIYVASALQLAPALAQQPVATQTAPSARPDFAGMETYVAAHPDDLSVRGTLIRDYYLYSIKQPRLNHIFWMIQNHPESDLTGLNSVGISPRSSALNDANDYQMASSLWRTQVSLHSGDAHVLANAARFFGQQGGEPDEAERLLLAARLLEPNNAYTQQLARLYGNAFIMNAGDPAYPTGPGNPSFAAKAKSELEASTDGQLLSQVGSMLTAIGRNPGPFGAGVDLAAHPALADLVTFGNQLVERSQRFGMLAARSVAPPRPQDISPLPRVSSPTVISRVMPVYPPAARAIQLSADMYLTVTIGTDGRVKDASVDVGHPMLRDAAIEAVKQWVFAPVMQNGIPTAAIARVVVPFRLDGSDGPLVSPNLQQQSATGEPRPATPQRIRVGGNVQKAKLQSSVDPVYPQAARDAGIEGTVELSIVIAKDGTVKEMSVVDGHPLLAAAAQQAVGRWVYAPTLLNGDPVEVVTIVSVPFKQ